MIIRQGDTCHVLHKICHNGFRFCTLETGNGFVQDLDEKNMFVLTVSHTYVQASEVDRLDGRLFAEILILCQCQLLMSMSMSINLCQSYWLIAMMYQCQQTVSVKSEH